MPRMQNEWIRNEKHKISVTKVLRHMKTYSFIFKPSHDAEQYLSGLSVGIKLPCSDGKHLHFQVSMLPNRERLSIIEIHQISLNLQAPARYLLRRLEKISNFGAYPRSGFEIGRMFPSTHLCPVAETSNKPRRPSNCVVSYDGGKAKAICLRD